MEKNFNNENFNAVAYGNLNEKFRCNYCFKEVFKTP